MTKAEQLLPKYEPMIRKIAWRVAKRYELDFEDIVQEGYAIFVDACERYDDSKASFSTFLTHRLRSMNDTLTVIRREIRQRQMSVRDEYAYSRAPSPVDEVERLLDELTFDELFDRWSIDAREVFDWMSVGPAPTKRPGLKQAMFYFGAVRHWAARRTIAAWEEIRSGWMEAQPALL